MNKLRRLTKSGRGILTRQLHDMRTTPGVDLTDLLTSSVHTEIVSPNGDVPDANFVSRREAAEAVAAVLHSAGVDDADARRDIGLWAWLAARWIDSLAPANSSGLRAPGATWRWIPDLNSHQTYYRHLLLGPYSIYRYFESDPDSAMSVLGSDAARPGEVVEQLASRADIITNRRLIAAATRLYWDGSSKKMRPGSGGKGPGSPRRLVEVFGQFDRTWDFHETPVDRILELLPSEFEKFKK